MDIQKNGSNLVLCSIFEIRSSSTAWLKKVKASEVDLGFRAIPMIVLLRVRGKHVPDKKFSGGKASNKRN